jgi:hypothetical protein
MLLILDYIKSTNRKKLEVQPSLYRPSALLDRILLYGATKLQVSQFSPDFHLIGL